ncbi:hypothetical protein BSKO_05556 [Bryopsis sp. KO-2023]|nr:hypothetical protein BSKO_05556 [Bryopsis sp. KO-2023]
MASAPLEPTHLRLKPLVTPLSPREEDVDDIPTTLPSPLPTQTKPPSPTRAPSAPESNISQAYFSELLSYSLERLNKEPELLKADEDRIHRQVTESAIEHYPDFINATDCLRDVEVELESLVGHLEGLDSGIPKFLTSCKGFREGAKEIMNRRGDVQRVMGQHQTLLGLLETPQLMDACVRNGNYDEALDFQLFVNRMGALHGELAVVKTLVKEVRGVTNLMLRQLMTKLKSNIQLPECLGVIGYLRRLAIFSERELRVSFLACREEWISGLVAEIDGSNPYDYLKRLTDIHRLHLFDVVMQYRAVFSDESSGLASNSVLGGDGGLLSGWVLPRIGFYLDNLRNYLPTVGEGSYVASILEHCMYCGMSLGRVGLDFRGLLPPVFEPCMLELFSERMVSAVESFENVLDVHKWVALPSSLVMRGSAQKVESNGQKHSDSDPGPPHALVEHLPIATLVNGVLSALNELRHCAPVSLKKPVVSLMQECLGGVASRMAQYSVTHGLDESQEKVFKSGCKALVESAAPHLCRSLDRLYAGASDMVGLESVMEPLRDVVRGAA